MKKQYISPSLRVMETEPACYVMASSTVEVTVQNEDFDSSTMTSLSRGNSHSAWDDEDEF